MDDRTDEWLRYLTSLRSATESKQLMRRAVAVPSGVALFIVSVLFIYANGSLILGLIGIGFSVLVIVATALFSLKNIVFVAGCDAIIRKILLDQLRESAQIDEELERLIRRAASRSAIMEGRRIYHGT